MSELERARKGPADPTGKNLRLLLARVKDLHRLGVDGESVRALVPTRRLMDLTRYGLQATAPQLRRHPPARRTATLVATVVHLQAASIDDCLELFDLIMTTELLGKAERETNKQRARDHPRLARASAKLAVAVEKLLEMSASGTISQRQKPAIHRLSAFRRMARAPRTARAILSAGGIDAFRRLPRHLTRRTIERSRIRGGTAAAVREVKTMSSSPPADTQHLRREQLGTASIVFLVLAAAAPMTAVVVTVPLAIGLGDGVGTPGAFALAGITLLLFAVGFVAMSRHVTNVGAFYAYITRGLGGRFGVPAALIALIAYNAMMIAVVGIFGVFANQSFLTEFGINLPWEAWGAIAVALVATLSYFEIVLSAKVLGVALVCEVIILTVMDIGVLLTNGPASFPIHSFSPGTIFVGAAGVSIMFAFTSFVGFEATAIYGEEAREPRRSVPRATYIAVGIIGIFYGVTSWALIAAFGTAHVVAVAGKNPAGFVFAANAKYIGGFTVDAMNILIVTSSFAALLAFHNAAARYIYGLARDGILPQRLAHTHPRYGSPIAASALQISVAVVVVAAFAVAKLDPLLVLAAAFLGLGTLGIIALQAMASFSVICFFRKRPDRDFWTTLVAPLLAGCGMTAAAFLVVKNYSALTGTKSALINHLWWLLPAVAVIGVLLAIWMQAKRPAVYAALGADRSQAETLTDSAPVEALPAAVHA